MTTTDTQVELDSKCIDTIRTLCMDAIQKAESGHPGTPMGIAPVAYALWQRVLRFDPQRSHLAQPRPLRPVRGSRLHALWSLLHLSGVRAVDPDYEVLGQPAGHARRPQDLPPARLDAPGHPEYRWTSGVETTTGPLGQGLATSVGMALAGQWLAARYNRDGPHAVRLRRLRAGRGRLHDGGHLVRGGVVRRRTSSCPTSAGSTTPTG